MSHATESLTVLLFALPRDLVGCSNIDVAVTWPLTAGVLKLALAQQYPALTDCLSTCRIVAANCYLADDQWIPRDVEVALIPPVSGG